ncbi:MAG: AMP-binding protein [Spirochaetia bacterium]|nr:AMP-binding protein [Spirochaetia bacterium]
MQPTLTLYEFLKETAGRYGQRIAFRMRSSGSWMGYSYDEWYRWIRELSLGLVDLGMGRQDKVAVVADNRIEWMVCSMAITTVGGVDVPRGTDATLDDLRYIIQHTEAPFMIVESARVIKRLEQDLPAFKALKHVITMEGEAPSLPGIKTWTLDQVRERGRSILAAKGEQTYHDLGAKVQPEDLASIIYTSGTTGTPKGVMLLHRNLVWEMQVAQRVLKLQGHISTMCFLPPWHIAERLIEMIVVQQGGTGNMTSIPTMAKDLLDVRPNFLVLVPRVWEALYARVQAGVEAASPFQRALFKFGERGAMNWVLALQFLKGHWAYFTNPSILDYLKRLALIPCIPALFLWNLVGQLVLSRIRNIFGGRIETAISGAGALPYKVDLFFRAAGIPILEAYGMTETTGVSIFRDKRRNIMKVLGAPPEGVQMQLRTEEGRVIDEDGVKGIAWHKGGHIMQGYFKEPEKTKLTIDKEGWLNSGDLLMRTVTGEYAFTGRAKDTIVLLGGENLEPVPIEDKLKESAFVSNVMIVGQDRKALGAIITPNVEAVKEWAKKNNFEIGEQTHWNSNDHVRDLYRAEIKRLISDQTGFKAFERVSTFHVLEKEFEAGKEMTQTMKVRRNVVAEMYAKEIDKMYE